MTGEEAQQNCHRGAEGEEGADCALSAQSRDRCVHGNGWENLEGSVCAPRALADGTLLNENDEILLNVVIKFSLCVRHDGFPAISSPGAKLGIQ